FVLGFSAVQLARPTEPDEPASLNLDELVRLGLLSRAPASSPRVPGSETEQAALGYLHANCSHCHNTSRPNRSGSRCFDPESGVDFSLRADGAPAVSETSAYRTAVYGCIEPGRPGDSR